MLETQAISQNNSQFEQDHKGPKKSLPSHDLLRQQLLSIKRLPQGRVERYSSFSFNKQDEFATPRSLDESSANELAYLLASDTEESDELEELEEGDIARIIGILLDPTLAHNYQRCIEILTTSLNYPSRDKQLEALDKIMLEHFSSRGEITVGLLAALGEVDEFRSGFFSNSLVGAFEKKGVFPDRLMHQLAALIQLNNEKGNLLFHKILDFFNRFEETLHNFTPEDDLWMGDAESSGEQLGWSFERFLEKNIKNCKNYLLKSHMQDQIDVFAEFVTPEDLEKPGMVHGMGGGAADKNIYKFQHQLEGYNNRLRLGIREGYPLRNPVLPVAPGYMGYYDEDRLTRIYKNTSLHNPSVVQQGYSKKNNPEYDYIYSEMDKPVVIAGRKNLHPSNKLQKLRNTWDFQDVLKADGQKYFFDITRLHQQDLHPLVFGDFLTNNQMYIHAIEGQENDVSPISMDEYFRLLYKDERNSIDLDQEYLYRYMMRLGMRKKLEDDFGIDLAHLPIHSQVQFLDFLNTASIEEYDEVLAALAKHPDLKEKIASSFLACAEDPGYSEYIIKLAQRLETDSARAVFDKYLEITAETEKVRSYITEHFPTADLKSAEVQSVVIQLLRKANLILKHFSERSSEDVTGAQINAELESIKTEIILFASTFKVGFEKYGLEFSDIKNTNYETRLPETLTGADKVRMEGMFVKNRPLYREELLKETVEDLQSAMEGEKNSVFYMLEHNKELVAFMRFDPIGPGRVYAGSLNVREEVRGSRLGTAMLRATLDEQGITADIEAVAYSKNPMLKHYVEDFGFEIVGEIPDYHGTGELFYKLLRKKKEAVPAKSYAKTP